MKPNFLMLVVAAAIVSSPVHAQTVTGDVVVGMRKLWDGWGMLGMEARAAIGPPQQVVRPAIGLAAGLSPASGTIDGLLGLQSELALGNSATLSLGGGVALASHDPDFATTFGAYVRAGFLFGNRSSNGWLRGVDVRLFEAPNLKREGGVEADVDYVQLGVTIRRNFGER